MNDDIAITRLLLDRDADLNVRGTYGETLLISAAGEGSMEKARLLVSKGADLQARDRWGRTALMQARSNGYAEIIQLLRNAGAKQ